MGFYHNREAHLFSTHYVAPQEYFHFLRRNTAKKIRSHNIPFATMSALVARQSLPCRQVKIIRSLLQT